MFVWCLQLLRAAWKIGSDGSFIPTFLICPGPSKQMVAQVTQMETRVCVMDGA